MRVHRISPVDLSIIIAKRERQTNYAACPVFMSHTIINYVHTDHETYAARVHIVLDL